MTRCAIMRLFASPSRDAVQCAHEWKEGLDCALRRCMSEGKTMVALWPGRACRPLASVAHPDPATGRGGC